MVTFMSLLYLSLLLMAGSSNTPNIVTVLFHSLALAILPFSSPLVDDLIEGPLEHKSIKRHLCLFSKRNEETNSHFPSPTTHATTKSPIITFFSQEMGIGLFLFLYFIHSGKRKCPSPPTTSLRSGRHKTKHGSKFLTSFSWV